MNRIIYSSNDDTRDDGNMLKIKISTFYLVDDLETWEMIENEVSLARKGCERVVASS